MKTIKELCADILVIGGGGAGLRAAIEAALMGSKVILVNKGSIAKSGTTITAAGALQAPFHPDDSSEQYFGDIIKCGYHLGDQNLARALATDACSSVLELERYGVHFARKSNGEFSLGQSPGQSKPRNVIIHGGGLRLVVELAKFCLKHESITIIDDFFVTGLVKGMQSGEFFVTGAFGVNLSSGELTLIKSKAVVMATGGYQRLWNVTDCPCDVTGDGIVYAYRIGAKLLDMELVLFYPSIIVWPPSLKGTFIPYEILDKDKLGGNIYDKHGTAILPQSVPVRDKATQLIARAIENNQAGEHGGLMWYVGDSCKGKEEIQKALNTSRFNYIKTHGIDLTTDKIEVVPGAHYLLGGICIDEECRTTIKGLFATPECAGNFEGANRLAGSGLAATQVFGRRAGVFAHKWSALSEHIESDPASLEEEICRIRDRIFEGYSAVNRISELRSKLCTGVQLYGGVIRHADGLNQLLQITREVKNELISKKVSEKYLYNQELVELLQLETMCEAAEIFAGSALKREESRGNHFRTDYPEQNDLKWLKHTCVVKDTDGPRFDTQRVISSI